MFSITCFKYLKCIGIKHLIIMIKLANIYTVFSFWQSVWADDYKCLQYATYLIKAQLSIWRYITPRNDY